MDGVQSSSQGFQHQQIILPMFQTVANIFESIYNGAKEVGDDSKNMLPRQEAALISTKRTMVMLILQCAVWSNEQKMFTQEDIKAFYKKDLNMLMIDCAYWTKKANLVGIIEGSATSFYEQMSNYKKQQPK